MPSKKKKYNARFPPARIKKIMQSDEDIGKVAQAVPVIISRALELFVDSLLRKAAVVTHARNAKTLTPSHLKQCIMAEQRFDFLKDMVATIPDVQGEEEGAETPRSASAASSFVFPPVSSTTVASSPIPSSYGRSAPSSSVSATSSGGQPVFAFPGQAYLKIEQPSIPSAQPESVIVRHSSSNNSTTTAAQNLISMGSHTQGHPYLSNLGVPGLGNVQPHQLLAPHQQGSNPPIHFGQYEFVPNNFHPSVSITQHSALSASSGSVNNGDRGNFYYDQTSESYGARYPDQQRSSSD